MIALTCNEYAFDDSQVKNMYQAFLLTVLLTASLNDLVMQKAAAIDCYFCGDSECADPFNKTASDVQVRNSTTNWCGVSIGSDHRLYLNACVHVYSLQKTKLQFKNDQEVSRGDRAAIVGLSITCAESKCYETKFGDMIVSTCCCNQNLCNDGRRMDVPGTSLLLTILISYLSC